MLCVSAVADKLMPDERMKLSAAFKEQQFQAGTTIVREGDDGHEFFIIKEVCQIASNSTVSSR